MKKIDYDAQIKELEEEVDFFRKKFLITQDKLEKAEFHLKLFLEFENAIRKIAREEASSVCEKPRWWSWVSMELVSIHLNTFFSYKT